MTSLKHWGPRRRAALVAVAMWLFASRAAAQGAVGSGPLTGSLTDVEPTAADRAGV